MSLAVPLSSESDRRPVSTEQPRLYNGPHGAVPQLRFLEPPRVRRYTSLLLPMSLCLELRSLLRPPSPSTCSSLRPHPATLAPVIAAVACAVRREMAEASSQEVKAEALAKQLTSDASPAPPRGRAATLLGHAVGMTTMTTPLPSSSSA